MAEQRKPKIVRRKRPLVVIWSVADRDMLSDASGQAIARQAREFGWDLLDLQFTNGSLPTDRKLSGALTNSLPTEPLARHLRDIGCPTVRIGRLPHPKDHLLPAVLPDAAATGRLAAEHFADRRFRNVAFIGHKPWSMGRLMYEGFRTRSEELGCKHQLLRMKSRRERGESEAEIYERRAAEVGIWLGAVPKPVGVLAYTDIWAAMLCTMCQRAGLSVPEDVAVLGQGNTILTCETAPVRLSSIDRAQGELGRQAALCLENLMRGGPAPEGPIMIPPNGVVERRSTDILAVDDPAVARAMRFIWDHLEQDLSVEAITTEVGVARRALERSFQQNLKHGINAELRRKRLERSCELLRSTNMTIADLAPKVGYRSADYLHASFKQAFGMTPRQYRLSQGRSQTKPPKN
jgi:LacI family transcriptional regulator